MCLMYKSIKNAKMYCDSLIADRDFHVGAKNDVIRPLGKKIDYIKTALDLRVPRSLTDVRDKEFDDTLIYDEVARIMSNLTVEGRLEIERYAKSLL